MHAELNGASHPLSDAERAAITRYIASIKQQLQEVSELFDTRYGKHSRLASLSAKALVCTLLLEDELAQDGPERTGELPQEESAIVKTASQGR